MKVKKVQEKLSTFSLEFARNNYEKVFFRTLFEVNQKAINDEIEILEAKLMEAVAQAKKEATACCIIL